MPDVSFWLTVGVMILSAGITWGVMTTKHTNSSARLHETINELKDAVRELRNLTTDFQVMKATTARSEKDFEKLELRVSILEAKLNS